MDFIGFIEINSNPYNKFLYIAFTSHSATFIFPSSTESILISTTSLILEISILVVFVWLILCLVANRLSLASLEPSKIQTIIFLLEISSTRILSKFEIPFPKSLNLHLEISFSMCANVDVTTADVVVYVEIGDGTSPVLLAGSVLGVPSRMFCLLFKLFRFA